MTIYHNSRDEKYRTPFGAVILGNEVTLALEVFDEQPTYVALRTWTDGVGEKMLPMKLISQGRFCRYEVKVKPEEIGVLWYSFKIISKDGNTYWYGARENCTGGSGRLYYANPPSFQITVYEERKLPEWYKQGIAYQILPDRFKRGADWKERSIDELKGRRSGPRRTMVTEWNEIPDYTLDRYGRVVQWDFYGGTLSGIIEKLDYLRELGITVIYLNPIFQAASNHRFDVGDYMSVAKMLGDEDTFKELCEKAGKMGMSIIIDGMFHYTGCDSIYFNRYDNYDSDGAFSSLNSPYKDWYYFDASQVSYESLRGTGELPIVNVDAPSYRNYIYGGEDSVVRHWLRAGAKGWRLDLADQLPDDFIEGIKKAILEERPEDGLLLGEVFDDASNKVHAGKLRKYVMGRELDSVMNYPAYDGIVAFIKGQIRAEELCEIYMRLSENYPPDTFWSALTILGSHERPRILTVLAETPDPNMMEDSEKKEFRAEGEMLDRARKRLGLALLLQMTMPGVPCIYYGDEAGLQGFGEPYNRATYPWGNEDRETMRIYRNAIGLRRSNPVFAEGDFMPMSFNQDVFGIRRRLNDEVAYVLVNRSPFKSYEVRVPKVEGQIKELLNGTYLSPRDGSVRVNLGPMESAVIDFYPEHKLSKPLKKGAAVECHITSLPNEIMPGTINVEAANFVKFLKRSGQTYWKVLPLNPTDEYGSPYAGISAFAGNEKLLGKSREELQRIYVNDIQNAEFAAYKEAQGMWLREYAMFRALEEKFGNSDWQNWPDKYKTYSEELYKDNQLFSWANYFSYLQFYFDLQWSMVRREAKNQGIFIIGDLPFYVDHNSTDVWAHHDLFKVDENGNTTIKSGLPRDDYYRNGILWGEPLYNWDEHKKDGFSWWMNRFGRAMQLYDYIVLDYFRGFDSAWGVDDGDNPLNGKWFLGAGHALFEKAFEKFGPLPFIADNLGKDTPSVRELINRCGFPGVDILQNFDGNKFYYEVPTNNIACSGTRNEDTFYSYCKTAYPRKDDAPEILIRRMYASDATVVMVPLQDALAIDKGGRMNIPGIRKGNWKWQVKAEDLEKAEEKLSAWASLLKK